MTIYTCLLYTSVKDIILALTAHKDNLLKISKDYSDFTNTKSGMKEAAKDDSFASDFLGGQNPFAYLDVYKRQELAPGETKTIAFLVGMIDNETAGKIVASYTDKTACLLYTSRCV